MNEMKVYERCNKECRSDDCDDYGVDGCAAFHTEEDHEEFGFCVKAAYASFGCEICTEIEYQQQIKRDKEKHE